MLILWEEIPKFGTNPSYHAPCDQVYNPAIAAINLRHTSHFRLQHEVVVLKFAAHHHHLLAAHRLRHWGDKVHAALPIDPGKTARLHEYRITRPYVRQF